MKVTIQAETKEEKNNFKEVSYVGVTDFYVDVRWVENKIVTKCDSRSHGDILYLVGRLYSALVQLKEYWRNTK